jgi:enterochelin esterase-like enzyme
MRRMILLIWFIGSFSGQILAQDSLRIMESLAMYSRILNQDVKFSVCLPEDYYKNDGSYPVVYMLHGLGDDAASWLEYGRISQYYDAERKQQAIVPMIFIMPEGYRSYYVNDYKGTFLYQDMFTDELVPYIDSLFRTIRDPRHRGLIGYSMGGFGALVMHLQHPDIFGSAVPLSISIRTDEQYMTEYAPEWDEQWGRLFGGVGTEGPERITDFYELNNPFYIVPSISSEYKEYRIYIDNGDKEETLCRSNEELHILMRNEDFPHEFRVREGGHSFSYWCSALPNALHFLSDAFEGKPYRGDIIVENNEAVAVDNLMQPVVTNIGSEVVTAFVPAEFNQTNRSYPALYVAGNCSNLDCIMITSAVADLIVSNEIAPMIVVFVPDKLLKDLTSFIPQMEKDFRIREGYRFRSLMGLKWNAEQVCDIVINKEQFSSCVLVDGYLLKTNISSLLNNMKPETLKKTPFYVIVPDKGSYYEGNGNLHMIFRDKEIKHEYRVKEGIDGSDLMQGELEEMIIFITDNFHR